MPLRERHLISAREPIPHCDIKSFPEGVRLFMWSRLVRWLGWGFGEALIPVFIFSMSVSYAEAGLMGAIYSLALVLALPIVGALADRMSAKTLILAGLLAYPLVGLGYFLAGVTGVAAFIILARGINGITWALEGTGIDTYYRRTTNRACLSSSFGYIETWANLGWIGAALAGIFLIEYVPIHWLLLMVAPFALFALPIALKAPADSPRMGQSPFSGLALYAAAFGELRGWNIHLHALAVLVLFMGAVATMVGFFIPIDAYVAGADLKMVILLGIVATVPMLFGYPLGRFADRYNKYVLLAFALIATALIMVALALFPQYWVKLVASFLLGVLIELLVVVGKAMVTTLGSEETYGLRGSLFESISTLGKLAAPLLIGISLDTLGFGNLSYIVAGIAAVLAVGFIALERSSLVTQP